MTDRELLQMALDALEEYCEHNAMLRPIERRDALRAALAQPEQEEDYDAIANKQLASLKAAAKVTFEDAVVRAVHKLYNAPPQPKPERYTTDAMKIKQAVSEAVLQQAEQEPTAYLCENAVGHKYFRWKKPSSEYKPIALYTAHASPQRIWQGLTDGEVVDRANAEVFAEAFARGVAWAELKLKEKNNG